MSGHTKWEDIKAKRQRQDRFHHLNRLVETWEPILGLDIWDFMDFTEAKEHTITAELMLYLYDCMPAGVLMTRPIPGYYYANSVELDDLVF